MSKNIEIISMFPVLGSGIHSGFVITNSHWTKSIYWIHINRNNVFNYLFIHVAIRWRWKSSFPRLIYHYHQNVVPVSNYRIITGNVFIFNYFVHLVRIRAFGPFLVDWSFGSNFPFESNLNSALNSLRLNVCISHGVIHKNRDDLRCVSRQCSIYIALFPTPQFRQYVFRSRWCVLVSLSHRIRCFPWLLCHIVKKKPTQNYCKQIKRNEEKNHSRTHKHSLFRPNRVHSNTSKYFFRYFWLELKCYRFSLRKAQTASKRIWNTIWVNARRTSNRKFKKN